MSWRTVLQNILVQAEVRRLDKKVHIHKAMDLINLTGLSGFENKWPYQLSGGMQQRLPVARALAKPHPILLAEQHTAGLDVSADAWARAALRQEAAEGRAVLLISYDLDELLAVSDRVAVLYDGRLLGPYPRMELSPACLADLMSGVGVAHETG